MLTWQRGIDQQTDCSKWTVYRAKESIHRVVRVVSLFGLPTRFVAMAGITRIISEHKTRHAAEKACNADNRKEQETHEDLFAHAGPRRTRRA